MKIFMDTEFTGLHQRTTLVSIGMVSENGKMFYAELTDYDINQVDDWLSENVINHLLLRKLAGDEEGFIDYSHGETVFCKGNSALVAEEITNWLREFGCIVEIWSDCPAYDWVLFCELFGGALKIPEFVYYIPFDIATVLKTKKIDPDISRELLANEPGLVKHNALEDAKVIKNAYEILAKND